MSTPLPLYETPSGAFAPASSLTTDEAVELHRKGMLQATDFEQLQPAAMVAVLHAIEERVRGTSTATVQFWGVLRPRRVLQGRA